MSERISKRLKVTLIRRDWISANRPDVNLIVLEVGTKWAKYWNCPLESERTLT